METELEAKFLDVNVPRLRATLSQCGAQCTHPERLMRRTVFDHPDNRLERIGGWVRVRDEGDKITCSYKQLQSRAVDGTMEATVTVSDYDGACTILRAIGLEQKAYQETRRETWVLDGCEVTIDTWPWIPTFVEIEGPDEATLRRVAAALGFDWKDAMHGSVETAYQRYYDVTEAEVDHWETITFVPVPDALRAKQRPAA